MPLAVTFATFLLLERHLTFFVVPLTFNLDYLPFTRVIFVLFSLTFDAACTVVGEKTEIDNKLLMSKILKK